ncbi:PA0069 family radical SAM protein [Maribacter polysiphoniae]|uniref:DNA repair photolyase n=1 Tax=Maribacter polysiphoniae TaxID=429344 RepID=A0A316E5G0_9FLAO|nr:PA0069 family radical SAM protein [Maribacter polysiphoniae]MBD1259891.1 PA0069 family radical SAM protein [Maribacter polysiphoniae]PWK25345.1 DNA repair photolyase [Maribacter polysiphoniae]
MKDSNYRKGRGAQAYVPNKFSQFSHETRDDFLEFCRIEGEEAHQGSTNYIPIFPKTIVNKVTSPDVGMGYSLNPYQGCEHGCIYCYARNTHEFWGYGAGLDFEQRILVKKEAPTLLEENLKSKRWKAETIVLSGNTDCYQPAEKKFELTRECLKVFLKYKHPVGIITKNALVLRDMDILKELAHEGLIAVNISVTSLSEETRRVLEPRTTTIKKRLETIRLLSKNGIPVNAMLAPIIPGINSHEIINLAKAVSDNGALSFGYTIVRLNGAIGQIFTDWIHKALPHKADKVLAQIKSCHGGTLNDSRFGMRSKGEGNIAFHIHDMLRLARRTYFKDKELPKLNKGLHEQYKKGQLKLF